MKFLPKKFLKKYKIINTLKYIPVPLVSTEKIYSLISNLKPLDTNCKLIRIGGENDGGYLIPDDLDDIKACFSPGVDEISEFEEDCFNKGMEIFLADKSVDRPKLTKINFSFIKKFIGTYNDKDFITLDQWFKDSKVDENEDIILQMDIEGAEYNSIINASDNFLNRSRIIVIEFHDLDKLWQPDFYSLADEVFKKILKNHTCVHIHPNNHSGSLIKNGIEIPRIAEFTFLRNDRIKETSFKIKFPHKLDRDNTQKETLILPKIWWS